MTWLYALPTSGLILLLMTVAVALAVGAHVLVRRFVPYRDLAKHNDVTGFVLAIVGVIYAVLLAFVVVVAWEEFNNAGRLVDAEVAAAADLYHLAGAYTEPRRSELRREILSYADLMQREEWPAMQSGSYSFAVSLLIIKIEQTAIAMIDAGAKQNAINTALFEAVRSLQDSRRERLIKNQGGIPRSLWTALIIGAIINLCFTYLFGVENFRLQLVMTGLLAALIALMFAITIALDYPFRGDTSHSAQPFHDLISRLAQEPGST